MKNLNKILQHLGVQRSIGNLDISIGRIVFDSRQAGKGDLFVAMRGTKNDGHQFISQVIQAGVAAVVCEKIPTNPDKNIAWIEVPDSSKALGELASAWFDFPSRKLKLVGVTGTNGKTTTATLLYKLFRAFGYKAGLFSTVCNYINDVESGATHTTPDAVQMNELMARMVNEGCEFCFMEVSSHAVHQNRIAGLHYAGALFTNITHDHLDYHQTFANYLAAKKKFFDDLPERAFALVNKDDRNGLVMLQNTKAQKKTFALKSLADFSARVVESHFEGMLLRVDQQEVWSHLKGEFNAYNFLGVYAAAVLLGENPEKVLQVMSSLREVRGRFETLRSSDGITAIVDYAHTPDALENVLKTIDEIRAESKVKIIVVMGAGGDRDKTKRPLMGKISARMCDRLIITSDNPRSEDPEKIIEDIKAGVEQAEMKKVLSIVNRKEAILAACAMANPGDIVLVAGKGHETYQDIKGTKYPFDDRAIVLEAFGIQKN